MTKSEALKKFNKINKEFDRMENNLYDWPDIKLKILNLEFNSLIQYFINSKMTNKSSLKFIRKFEDL